MFMLIKNKNIDKESHSVCHYFYQEHDGGTVLLQDRKITTPKGVPSSDTLKPER
jgi:hypothetical protein